MAILKTYTLKEAAAAMGISNRTLERHVQQGKIKGAKVGGVWRFTEDDINAFLRGDKPTEKNEESGNE